MKNKRNLATLLLPLLTGGIMLAQTTNGELKLSLKEARDYALQHNKMVYLIKDGC